MHNPRHEVVGMFCVMTSTENLVYSGRRGSTCESLWRVSASTFPDELVRQMLCANLSEKQEGERIWHLILWCFLDHADIVRSFMGRKKERVQIVAGRTQTPEKEVAAKKWWWRGGIADLTSPTSQPAKVVCCLELFVNINAIYLEMPFTMWLQLLEKWSWTSEVGNKIRKWSLANDEMSKNTDWSSSYPGSFEAKHIEWKGSISKSVY